MMKLFKSVLLLFILTSCCNSVFAQKYKSSEAKVTFFSEALIENITASNTYASSAFDVTTGNIVFSVRIKGFQFAKSLMQEHFNENYMESEKYPKAIFVGKFAPKNLKSGMNEVTVTGELDMHGVKNEITVIGTMNHQGDVVLGKAEFTVLLKDYDIKIPTIVFRNIAEEILVTVDFTYEKI